MFRNMFGAFKRLLPGAEPPVLERREIVRIPCKVPAVCRLADGTELKAVVVDMGMRGLRLETAVKLPKAGMVHVLRPGGGPIGCRVAWNRPKRFSDQHLAGLEFSDSAKNMRASWIKGTLQKLGFEPGRIKEKRKHIRVPAEQRATLVSTAGDELTEGVLINLGIGGALAQMHVEIPANVKVSLRVDPVGAVPPLEMACTIRSSWKNERNLKYMHGLRFDDQDNALVKKYLKILMKSV
jgi:PilZ domain